MVKKAHPAGPRRWGQRRPASTVPLNSSCAAGGSTAGGAALRGAGAGAGCRCTAAAAESSRRPAAGERAVLRPGEAAAPGAAVPGGGGEDEGGFWLFFLPPRDDFHSNLIERCNFGNWGGFIIIIIYFSPIFFPASRPRSTRSASRQVRCPDLEGLFPRRRTSLGDSGEARGPAHGAPPCAVEGGSRGPGPRPQPPRLPGRPDVGAGCRGAGEPGSGFPYGETAELFLPSLFACSQRGFYFSLR